MSAINVARAGKGGNICVGSNVSATMCPRLPVPLGAAADHSRNVLVAVTSDFRDNRARNA